jgi:hypothetical protein
MPWPQYLELAEWAAMQIYAEQAGRDPPRYFAREKLDPLQWRQAVDQFDQWFGRAVGRSKSIQRLLQRTGRRWLHGIRRCRATFS